MRFLVIVKFLIGIGRCDQCDGIKAGCIKGNHRERQKNQYQGRQRKRADNSDNRSVEITGCRIEPNHVELAEHL